MIDPSEQTRQLQMRLKVLRGQTSTIAEVELIDEDIWGRNEGHRDERAVQGSAIGESKLSFSDEYNFQIGDEYAIGRALKQLGEMLIKKANFRVEFPTIQSAVQARTIAMGKAREPFVIPFE